MKCKVPGCKRIVKGEKGLAIHMTKSHPGYIPESIVDNPIVEPATDGLPKEDIKTEEIETCGFCGKEFPQGQLLPHLLAEHIDKKKRTEEPKPDSSQPIRPMSKFHRRSKKEKTDLSGPYKPYKDPEPLLDMLLGLPAIILFFGTIAFFILNPGVIQQISEISLFVLFFYAIGHIGETVAMMIISIFAIIGILFLLIFHQIAWRMAFPDFQMAFMHDRLHESKIKDGPRTTKRVLMPRTVMGRVYLTVGYGKIDKWYRKKYNAPVPDTKILFIRRGWFSPQMLNPFRPLSSCDKVYVYDPDNVRYSKSGLFRRTVRGSHLRREFEGNAEVYYLMDDAYDQPDFNSKWYQDTYDTELKTGMVKITNACLINPDIQQDQMRRNLLYLPQSEIIDDIKLKSLREVLKEATKEDPKDDQGN
jgi:hypothetical protein